MPSTLAAPLGRTWTRSRRYQPLAGQAIDPGIDGSGSDRSSGTRLGLFHDRRPRRLITETQEGEEKKLFELAKVASRLRFPSIQP